MPADDLYMPICVGSGNASLSKKYQSDDVGDNISDKNSTYCELTAIYWAWKNLDVSTIGVAHYRRHFSILKGARTLDKVLTGEQLNRLFTKYGNDTVFATPLRRYIESIENHYIHSLKGYEEVHARDIKRLREAIHNCGPMYDKSAEKVLGGRAAHMLNMFIMNAKYFREYCGWLFPIIDSVVAMSKDRTDQRRYAGALSEFCLDIWAQSNGIKIVELPLLETEKPTFFARMSGYICRKL